MKTKPCPNCGAPKHPLKSCPQCGLSILHQEWMERRAKSFYQDTQDREIQINNDALLAPAREIKSEEQIRNNPKSSPSKNTAAPIIRTTTHLKQSTIRKQRSEAKKLSEQSKPKIQRNKQARTTTQTQHFFWKCPVCHASFLSKQAKTRHIKVHGINAIARAIAEQIISANKQTIATKVSTDSLKISGTQVARAKEQNVLFVESPAVPGACRICGKNKPMLGEDTCFHCQSE